MSEKITLHLRTQEGTQQEKRFTVFVDQKTMDQIQTLINQGMKLTEAYLKVAK